MYPKLKSSSSSSSSWVAKHKLASSATSNKTTSCSPQHLTMLMSRLPHQELIPQCSVVWGQSLAAYYLQHTNFRGGVFFVPLPCDCHLSVMTVLVRVVVMLLMFCYDIIVIDQRWWWCWYKHRHGCLCWNWIMMHRIFIHILYLLLLLLPGYISKLHPNPNIPHALSTSHPWPRPQPSIWILTQHWWRREDDWLTLLELFVSLLGDGNFRHDFCFGLWHGFLS